LHCPACGFDLSTEGWVVVVSLAPLNLQIPSQAQYEYWESPAPAPDPQPVWEPDSDVPQAPEPWVPQEYPQEPQATDQWAVQAYPPAVYAPVFPPQNPAVTVWSYVCDEPELQLQHWIYINSQGYITSNSTCRRYSPSRRQRRRMRKTEFTGVVNLNDSIFRVLFKKKLYSLYINQFDGSLHLNWYNGYHSGLENRVYYFSGVR